VAENAYVSDDAAQADRSDRLIPLTPMRHAIAQNMVKAWVAPHAHAMVEVDMSATLAYRDSHRADFARETGFDLSPAALIIKAAAESLCVVPLMNSAWSDEGIVQKGHVNIGYAIALDGGLVVPVVRDVDDLSVGAVMRALRNMVDRAKLRKLKFEDLEGATFTVNNTGPLGTVLVLPIVPSGQAGIVTSESIVRRVVVVEGDRTEIRPMMNLVIGFDHRAIDGATAARFLSAMKAWLQEIRSNMPL
jgi:pyruvate/2-oxoglutarate dehydrogenase complex dihydrolipoamide acyltransferase (E2) component